MPLIPSLLGDLGMYCLEEATIGGLITSIREQAPEVGVAPVFRPQPLPLYLDIHQGF
jgi:hypothetical protein